MRLSPQDRVIMALDVPSPALAVALVRELEGVVSFYKLGLELLMAGGLETLLRELSGKHQLFVDLKLPSDIPTTVQRTVSVAADLGVQLFTLSGSATAETIEAAVKGRGTRTDPKLLFVPFLSSQGRSAAPGERFEDAILAKARFAANCGVDGFIVSGQEIAVLRQEFPDKLLVSPGIRPSGSATDDHQRSCTPAEAIALGADQLVVGRPIRDAADRRGIAAQIIAEVASALG
jgi:orotidine-5'-phosphate decarboxylase